jgi:hypothetical protein
MTRMKRGSGGSPPSLRNTNTEWQDANVLVFYFGRRIHMWPTRTTSFGDWTVSCRQRVNEHYRQQGCGMFVNNSLTH